MKQIVLEPLSELLGIGIGKAAAVLNTMLGSHVRLSVPALRIIQPADLANALSTGGEEPLSAVEMEFSGEISGCAELIFTSRDAGSLVDCITDSVALSCEDIDSLKAGTLCEVGNIVINAIIGTIANVAKVDLSYTIPLYLSGSPDTLLAHASYGADVIILVTTRFQVERIEVDGDIVLFLSLASFESLTRALDRFADA